eukprot:445324_1
MYNHLIYCFIISTLVLIYCFIILTLVFRYCFIILTCIYISNSTCKDYYYFTSNLAAISQYQTTTTLKSTCKTFNKLNKNNIFNSNIYLLRTYNTPNTTKITSTTLKTILHIYYNMSRKNKPTRQKANQVLKSHVPAKQNTLLHNLVRQSNNRNNKRKQKQKPENVTEEKQSQDNDNQEDLELHLSLSPDIQSQESKQNSTTLTSKQIQTLILHCLIRTLMEALFILFISTFFGLSGIVKINQIELINNNNNIKILNGLKSNNNKIQGKVQL